MATLRESDSYYLDVFTREAGLCQKIGTLFGALVEKLAARRQIFVSPPYRVKGMNFSFKCLLTATIDLLHRGKYTEKPELPLIEGAAVNKRLQSILETIAKKNNARLCAAPKQRALGNGAMIAWTGGYLIGMMYRCQQREASSG